jgi:hypothetical protein
MTCTNCPGAQPLRPDNKGLAQSPRPGGASVLTYHLAMPSSPGRTRCVRPGDDGLHVFRFSFQTTACVLATSFVRGLQIRSPKRRGRREDRVRAAPAVSCANMHIEKRTRAYRFSGSSPAFPAQWFYGLFRALPGETRLVCHRHPRDAKHHRELDASHWGIRTTRLHRPLQPRSSVAALASIAPRAQRP